MKPPNVRPVRMDGSAQPSDDEVHVQEAVVLAFLRAGDNDQLGVTGSACLIDGEWVDMPAKYVLNRIQKFDSGPSFVDFVVGYRLSLEVDMTRGGHLMKGHRDTTTMIQAITSTLAAHGVDSSRALVDAILTAVAECVVVRPPVVPTPEPTPELREGMRIQWDDRTYLVTKIGKKGTVRLQDTKGRATVKAPLDVLQTEATFR